MVDGATRVALLARPGDARERLASALREAGADLVAVADPVSTDASEVAAASPQAILVALEPAIEDALEAYESLLGDPRIAVIFDEAELAAQRAGWDAARWVRHLAAKLNRHDDVLPPGREQDGEWQPSPGPLSPGYREASALELASIAGEMQAAAEEVPRNDGLDAVEPAEATPHPMGPAHAAASTAADEVAAFAIDIDIDDDVSVASAEDIALGGMTLQEVTLDGLDVEGLSLEDISFEAGDDVGSARDPADDAGEATAATEANADDDDHAVAADSVDDSELTLIDDAVTGPDSASAGRRFSQDLADLEVRIAGLELADADSYGHGPEQGAVLIEGGLGGPDAVRQLLAAIPSGFPRPLLVRLRLDGGRYDRLVRQMERAAQLPAVLAEDGAGAEAGHVYFLPPDITIVRDRGQLRFTRAEGAGAGLPEALPPGDSAVLFLSGSDPSLVDAAMGRAWGGALVAGQSPEGCYDGAAADVVIARGGESGMPRQLAARLSERWPSSDRPAGADLEEPEA
ncbi:chemotaxis protein CheB [Luteimonas suaedae]|uniref:chemotaxis protein CheB n=1 Tax=Luteimonas suaedae TaxID=2605430 RepID=UPI0011F0708C|nr:chemotaxis protein CheB [Luteimonas suaedae]